jgi:hypothetical protein
MARFFFMILLAAAAVVEAAPVSQPHLFATEPLAAWEPLDETTAVPYGAERLKSEFLYGARSPHGSYVFITRMDNTLQRRAFSPEDLLVFASPESFARLRPSGFRSEITAASLSEGGTLPCVVASFLSRNLGYSVGKGSGDVVVKTAFLPVVLWDRDSETYSNSIYVANFRGATEDVADFDRVWRHVALPQGSSVVSTERFNALQPELAQRGGQPPAAGRTSPVKDRAAEPEPDAEAVARSLLARLAGPQTEPSPALRRAAAAHPGTALAGIVAELDGEPGFELQKAVWEHALTAANGTSRPRLVALFLAASFGAGDLRLAEAVAASAIDAKLGLADLDAESLAIVLDPFLRHPPSPLWPGPSLRRFLAFGSGAVPDRLRSLLQKRGIEVPDLQRIADRDRNGRWQPKAGGTRLDAPGLAAVPGGLMLVRSTGWGRQEQLEVREVTSLLQLAAAPL